ncbi:MAG: threonylcarbamoyl-AMP synthase, partial [Proteobacteria bacterium]|nr:threonylcarbamoyl-AMP synthase [Pseudomonadota bacterium]
MKPTRAALRRAAKLLRRGRLVAFPTETVYGLGGDAGSSRAVAAIYAAKSRPGHNPLIVHVADVAAAQRLVRFNDRARALARAFWPGPLTLVLRRRPGVRISRLVARGLDTLAIRVADHKVARALLRATARPLAAPSANRSGRMSPTRAQHVVHALGCRVPLTLDGGPCIVGVESTVVDLAGGRAVLLRPGGVPREAIEAVIGPLAGGGGDARPKSPGQLASHYAPRLPLRLDAPAPRPGEAYLAFGKSPAGLAARSTRNLSPSGDLAAAAANLFAMLRALDRPEFAAIAVAPIPERGLGVAVNDRLRRAAAPRRGAPS